MGHQETPDIHHLRKYSFFAVKTLPAYVFFSSGTPRSHVTNADRVFFAAREWIPFLGLFPNINVEKLYLAFVAGYFLHTLTAVFLPSRFVEKVTPSFTSSRYLSEPLPLF